MASALHIVSFDIPYPPDYGGAIDVFYKVKHLSEAGLRIYLHCPQYGDRKPSRQLEDLCEKVWYYPRKTGLNGLSAKLPYTVYSRRHENLLANLMKIDAPILFDGVSASYYMNDPGLKHRVKILRNQNVEQDYFRLLGERERSLFKRIYYLTEAKMLKKYEAALNNADAFFTVALHDHDFFKKRYPKAEHEYIPSFQPYDTVESAPGTGEYAIYHGNLGLAENMEAAMYLLREIVPHVSVPFIIAGRNPGPELAALVQQTNNCKLIADPGMDEMARLINNAHIQVLPTFQNTGLKLKLLHALFNGRHVVVNEQMVHGTGLESVCTIAKDSKLMVKEISRLMNVSFTNEEIISRKQILENNYSNKRNAQKIITFLQQRSP